MSDNGQELLRVRAITYVHGFEERLNICEIP